MSPWSEWSTCPQQCVPDSSAEVRDGEVTPTQSRRRVVIQWPANGGLPCQNLEELRPCPLSGARCKHYLWGIGPWSDCQLPANVECGMGYRTRVPAMHHGLSMALCALSLVGLVRVQACLYFLDKNKTTHCRNANPRIPKTRKRLHRLKDARHTTRHTDYIHPSENRGETRSTHGTL
uniref:Uncharacterized protein n=1 Tax=Timema douglasi TaxID=61478 RepID=A0A7R8VV19_TIMDO|nr:unnamed protein product [Timema douglasi]